jgi:putative addiction module component (TIGR02574 family)
VTYAEILNLAPSERLQLLEAIWDSLIEVPEAIPVSPKVKDELDRRLEAYYRDPETARPWDEIKEELFRGK